MRGQFTFYLWRWTLVWVTILDGLPTLLTLGAREGGHLAMRYCFWAVSQDWYKATSVAAVTGKEKP